MSSDSRLIQSLEDTAQFISNKYKLDDVLSTLTKRRRNSLKSSSSSLTEYQQPSNIPQIALEKVRQHQQQEQYAEEDDGASSVHSARSHSSMANYGSSFKHQQVKQVSSTNSKLMTINTNNLNSSQELTTPTANSYNFNVLTPTGYAQLEKPFQFQNQSINSNRPGSAASSNSCLSRSSVSQPMYPISNSKLSSPDSAPNHPFSENQTERIPQMVVATTHDITPNTPRQALFPGMEDPSSLRMLQEIHDPKSSVNSSRSNSSMSMRLMSPNNSFHNHSYSQGRILDEVEYQIEEYQSLNNRSHISTNSNQNNPQQTSAMYPQQDFIEPLEEEQVENYEIDDTYEIENSQLNRFHLTTSESIINDVFDNNKQTRETLEQVISQLSQADDELDKQEDELIKEQFLNPLLNRSINSRRSSISSNNQSMNCQQPNQTIQTIAYQQQQEQQSNTVGALNNGNNNDLSSLCIPPLNEDVDLKARLVYYTKYLCHSHEKIKIESIKNISELVKNQYQSLQDVYCNIVDLLNNNFQLFYNQTKVMNRQVISLLILLYRFVNNEMIDNVIDLLQDKTNFEIFDCLLTLLFRLGIQAIERIFEILNNESEWNNIIISHIVNHPLIIQNVVIPVLHKECLSFDYDKRVCAVRAVKHLGMIAIKCLPTLLNMLNNGSIDRVLIGQAIRSMGEEGEKSLIKLMEQSSNAKVKEAIATVFGELPYRIQSHLTIIANSDIHNFIKSPNPRILYYFCGDESRDLPPLLLFDSRELISNTRSITRDGLLDEIEFGNQFTCKSELTLLHAMVCSLKPVIYSDFSSTINNTLLNNNNTLINGNTTLNNTNVNNTTNLKNNTTNLSTWMVNTTNVNATAMSASFNNLSYNASAMDQNTSFSVLKGYYVKECNRLKKFYQTDQSECKNMYLNSYFEQVQVNVVTNECVNSLICNFRYMEECVRIASVKSVINLINLTLPNFNQVIESLKLECLTDPSPRVRSLALDAFAKIGKSCSVLNKREKRSILQCVLPLIRDSHWHVRMAACNALCEHYLQIISMSIFDKDFYKQVFHILITALREGTMSRDAICKCLSLLEYDGISQLIYLLRQDSQSMSIQVRISACFGLSLISIDSPYIDRIVETLFMTCNSIEKTPPLVRRAAIKSLGDLASKSKDKLTYLGPRSLLPFLYSFLKDKQSSVRQMAAQVLAHSGPHGELLLMEALLKDSNPNIRSSAAFGMTFIGPKSIISLILALSNELNTMVKKSIYNAIESFKFDDILSIIENKSQKDTILNTVHSILGRIEHARENCYPSDYVLDLFNYIINKN